MASQGESASRATTPAASLPSELVSHIVRLAAATDRRSALTLSLASKRLAAWTYDVRWRTIVIRSATQLRKLWDIVLAYWLISLDPKPHEGDATQRSQRERGRECVDRALAAFCPWIPRFRQRRSLPVGPLSLSVRNLFIELPEDERLLDRHDEWAIERGHATRRLLEELDDADLLEDNTKLVSQLRNYLKSPSCGRWNSSLDLAELLSGFEHVDLLSLGTVESELLTERHMSIRCHPRELSLVYTGNEEFLGTLLRDMTVSVTSEPAPRRQTTGQASRDAEAVRVSLCGFRQRLERLHLVGIDSRAGLAGVPPPDWLATLRRGSAADRGFTNIIQCLNMYLSQRSVLEPHTFEPVPVFSSGLTHLRYDTRRFSFKPAEITALRLRSYFEEVCVERSRFVEAEDAPPSLREGRATAEYSYSGPRHAAPSRGAGSHLALSARSRQGHVGSSRADAVVRLHDDGCDAAQVLRSWGFGGFRRLHLAWDAAQPTRAGHGGVAVPSRSTRTTEDGAGASKHGGDGDSGRDSKRGGADGESTSLDDANGGWPAERRGAWTERPAGELISSFAAELADAVQQLYGWSPSGILAPPTDAVEPGGPTSTPSHASSSTSRRRRRRAPRYEEYSFSRASAGTGESIPRIEAGWDERSRSDLAVLERHVRHRLESDAETSAGGAAERGNGSTTDVARRGAAAAPLAMTMDAAESGPASGLLPSDRHSLPGRRSPPATTTASTSHTGTAVGTSGELTRDDAPPSTSSAWKLRYAVRAPATLLKLGGRAAFELEDRLALFEDRSAGGPGAWR